METVDRTYQLLGKGLLGPWQVAGVTIVGLIVVTLLLRGDLKGVPQRLRLGLLTARAVIVLLAGWFLFQPSLYVKETLSQPGRLVVVLDDSASMGIQDPAPGLSDLLDRVEIVRGKPLKGRVRSPGAFVSLVERLEPEVSNDAQILDNVLSRIEEELPWRATLRDQLKRMASRWDESAKKIDNHAQTIRSEILSAKVGGSGADDETSQRRSRLMASAQRLSLVGPVFQKLASRLRTLAEERSLDPTAFRETQTLMNEATVGLEEAREQATGIRDIMDRRYFSAALEARRKELKSQARLSRIEIAHRLLRRHVPSLSKKHRLSYQLLSRSAVLNAMPENIRTESDRTEFAGALRNVLNTYSRDVIAGIILVSDGRRSRRSRSEQDTPGDLRPVLESLEGMSVPLHTFLLGSEDDAPDLAVADYEIPSLLRKGGRATITVTIKTAVPEGTACRVTVSRIGVAGDETALAEASFVADGSSERLVLLEVRPEVAGTNPIRIAVSAEETEDRFPTNDSVVESLGVVEGRLRCFVLGDVPDWNMRAAVQALDELPVRMKTFFSGQSDEEPPRGSGNDKVPETAEQWGKYDIAVLGGAVFPGFNAKDASAIVEAAREKGLGLFVLPGPDPDYAGWMAQQLGWPTGMKPLESPSGPGDSANELMPAESAFALPGINLRAGRERSLAAWEQLARPRDLKSVPSQEIPLLKTVSGDRVASYGMLGKGRCVIIGIGDIYSLRDFTGRDGDGPSGWRDARRFLRGLIVDAARDPFDATGEKSWGLLPVLPVAGAPVQIYVRNKDNPDIDGTVKWVQKERSGDVKLKVGDGVLTGDVVFDRPGPVTLRVGSTGMQAKTLVRSAFSTETISFRSDKRLMRAIAEKTGGLSVEAGHFDSLVESIEPRKQFEVRVHEYSLWHNVWMLLVMVGLVTGEYLMRRKAGKVL